MSLLDLWRNDRAELENKHVQQVIAFAGEGKLLDGSDASTDFREYLRHIPSNLISKYCAHCLEGSFQDSGLALQDIVNEIGRRLNFKVSHGRYRGRKDYPGQDGLWENTDPYRIIVEVKTTDAYRIDLNTIANYRKQLVEQGLVELNSSSMLVVVGRQDTGDLEAQIRGSRFAWDMRVISVDALLRMLKLKEQLEEPSLLRRIHEILIPHEFTRLDPIIEIAFAAVSDVTQDSEDGDEEDSVKDGKSEPLAFHDACMSRIESKLQMSFVKHSRASFSSADELASIVCAVSRYHERAKRFWFAFHPHQRDFLKQSQQAFVAYGCGDENTLFLIPFKVFLPWLDSFGTTERADRSYWHVKIRRDGNTYFMTTLAGSQDYEITKYLV